MRRGAEVTRIVPAWDSGGSSKPIRAALGVLSIGDIRNALMALAHGEGRAGHLVKVFNTRLSDSAQRAALHAELAFYSQGLHPALRAMEPAQRASIIGFLGRFISEAGPDFDLRRGSLGNFVLAGAYLTHGRDINAAISVFRRLLSIRGNVWPASSQNDLQLHARLTNGETLAGQHRITALEGAGIRAVWLEPAARANPRVLESVASADAIVLGPGSFFTSVLPHLLVPGIAAALGASRAPKIFVGNMLECSETAGLSLNHMLEELCRHGCPTHVLANRSPMPLQRSVGGRRYIALDEGDALLRQRSLQIVSEDFEDPWQRGVHDAGLVAAAIARLSGG